MNEAALLSCRDVDYGIHRHLRCSDAQPGVGCGSSTLVRVNKTTPRVIMIRGVFSFILYMTLILQSVLEFARRCHGVAL